jgi:signal transduction histidine kinase
VRVVVEDNGPGIPDSIRERLFQPFVTGRGRESARPGTGLGLAIARGIAERHHGKLSAGRSELGGARFELELPRSQPVLVGVPASGVNT